MTGADRQLYRYGRHFLSLQQQIKGVMRAFIIHARDDEDEAALERKKISFQDTDRVIIILWRVLVSRSVSQSVSAGRTICDLASSFSKIS